MQEKPIFDENLIQALSQDTISQVSVPISVLAWMSGGKTVKGKKFERCTILGPAVLGFGLGSDYGVSINNPNFFNPADPDAARDELIDMSFWMPEDGSTKILGVTIVRDCVFDDCTFVNIGFVSARWLIQKWKEQVPD